MSKKMMKRIPNGAKNKCLSLFLCVCLLLGAVCPAFAQRQTARLYNVYGDHMLFQQKEDAVFAGEAAPGTALTVTLKDASGAEVRTARGDAAADGSFSLSFPAPAGSFESYSVTLFADGAEVCTLTDVVFGELWLSFGQSNMEYSLSATPEGIAMQQAGTAGSRNLRVLQVPHPVKNGSLCAEVLAQTDAQNCYWYTGDQSDVFGMSAVGYFFAEKLLADLQVPVGILNTAVGGSAIAAWISREALAGDPDVTQTLAARGGYIAPEDWEHGSRQYQLDMTGIYNTKIAPLTPFRPAGAVWYQGETDLMFYDDPAFYEQLFTLMQDSYTEAFSHRNGRLPMVFTQLVSYNYDMGPYEETRFNEAFTRLAAADPASRGEVVISDLSPAYYDDCGAIHPMTKKPIGERMESCARALVYGSGAPVSAPAMTDVQTQDGSLLVTFSNAGEGLICTGETLRGFAVCGADGVCLPAEAELVGADTVRLHSDAVASPVGAVYAANSLSLQANLWSSFDGAPYLPAAAFGASDPAIRKLFDDAEWLRCDTLTAWQNSSKDPGQKQIWSAQCAALGIAEDAAKGSGSLQIDAKAPCFSVSTVFSERKNLKEHVFDSLDTDFSYYGALTLRLKNNGKNNVTLTQLRLYTGDMVYFCPLCSETGRLCAEIPADGAWHTYSFDLNKLGLYGAAIDCWSNAALKSVTSLRLCFAGFGASIRADDFRFLSDQNAGENRGAVLQRILAYILALSEKIKAVFMGNAC